MKTSRALKGFAPPLSFILLLAMLGVFGLAIVLVNPLGNFPTVDDWAYAQSVELLVNQGRLLLHPWTSPNMLSQILWGAGFAWPLGASFTVLRFSTLVAAALGALALFRIFTSQGAHGAYAALGAVIILFNPIAFSLSFSFMGDVPFAAACAGAIFFLLRHLQSSNSKDAALGWALALTALLCRQTALFIPLSYACAYLFKHDFGAHGFRLKTWAMAFAPLVVFAGVQKLYGAWAVSHNNLPDFGKQAVNVMDALALSPWEIQHKIHFFAGYLFFYCGLFFLPFSLVIVGNALDKLRPLLRLMFALDIVLSALYIFYAYALPRGQIMPFWFNAFAPHGLDCKSLWLAVTFFAVLGGVCLVLALALALRAALIKLPPGKSSLADKSAMITVIFAAAALSALLVSTALVDIAFDRYLLPFFLMIAVFLSVAVSDGKVRAKGPLILGASLLFLMMAHATAFTHDVMVQKRTRLFALNALTAEGVARKTIDAGFDFNGNDLFTLKMPVQSSVWVENPSHIIHDIGRQAGYEPYKTYPFSRWLPRYRDGNRILVQKRAAGAPGK